MVRYKRTAGDFVFDGINGIIMICLVLITGYPLLYVLFYSLSGGLVGNGLLFWPKGFTLGYYKMVFQDSRVLTSALVSAARTVIGPFSMLFVTSMAAYVMADKAFSMHKFFWRFFLITMFISGGMIPSYLLIKGLGLNGTFLVYILPSLFGGTYNMILLKTYIEQLPDGLRDAATIDGANDVMLFFRIIIPLTTPILATVGLFSAVGHWNSWIDTMLYNAERPDLHTMQYNLMIMINQYTASISSEQLLKLRDVGVGNVSPEGLKAALTFVTIIPILMVYPFVQRHFTKGLLIGSIKA